MTHLLIAALIAAAPAATAPDIASSLDLGCYRLMAEYAEDPDPGIRAGGLMAAHYFLGRLDAAAPGIDVESLPGAAPAGDARAQLLRDCGSALDASGRDFRALGEALAPPSRPRA